MLRGQLDPDITHVIPNALFPSQFTPADNSTADPGYSAWDAALSLNVIALTITLSVTIVVISRLVYRKGVDLLVAAAPHICRLFPEVRFVIGASRFSLPPSAKQ